MPYMQGNPGGKISILGGASIGHGEEKKRYICMCVLLNGYRDKVA